MNVNVDVNGPIGETRAMDEEALAKKPPSCFCHALVTIFACGIAGVFGISSLVIALTTFPYNRHPLCAVTSGVQIGFAILGIVGASSAICCSAGQCACWLLGLAATALLASSAVLGYICIGACAHVVRADPEDWCRL